MTDILQKAEELKARLLAAQKKGDAKEEKMLNKQIETLNMKLAAQENYKKMSIGIGVVSLGIKLLKTFLGKG